MLCFLILIPILFFGFVILFDVKHQERMTDRERQLHNGG